MKTLILVAYIILLSICGIINISSESEIIRMITFFFTCAITAIGTYLILKMC